MLLKKKRNFLSKSARRLDGRTFHNNGSKDNGKTYFRCAKQGCHATAYMLEDNKLHKLKEHADHCEPDGKDEVIAMKEFMKQQLKEKWWRFLDLYIEACTKFEENSRLEIDLSTSRDCAISYEDVIEEVIEEVSIDVGEEEKVQSNVYSIFIEETDVENKIEDKEVESEIEEEIVVEESREPEMLVETPSIENLELSRLQLSFYEESNQSQMEIQLEDSPIFSRNRNSKQSSKSSKNEVEILMIYPPPPTKGGISINTEDYKCLGRDKFLNDVIIDFYLKYLTLEVLSRDDRQRTHVFSSHFFTRLAKPYASTGQDSEPSMTEPERRHIGVQRWTKNVNIFEKDFVIIPVNEHAHWFLVIICFPHLIGNIRSNRTDCFVSGSELQKPCLLIFDSLGKSNKTRLATILRGYLRCEYLAKMNEDKIFSGQFLKVVYPAVPKQTNATDCGLYLLQYVESFFKNPITDFTFPFKNLSEWFKRIVVVRKREEIANLITELALSFNKNRSVNLPDVTFPTRTADVPSDKEADSPVATHREKITSNIDAEPTHSASNANPHDTADCTMPWVSRSRVYDPIDVQLIQPPASRARTKIMFADLDSKPQVLRPKAKFGFLEADDEQPMVTRSNGSQFLVDGEAARSVRPRKTAARLNESAKLLRERRRLSEDKRFYSTREKATKGGSKKSKVSLLPGNGVSVSSWISKNRDQFSDSTDPFYNLSMASLQNDTTISPGTSYSNFRKMKFSRKSQKVEEIIDSS